MRKVIITLGLIGALIAAEGLNRFGSVVGFFRGADAPIYQSMLAVSVVSAGVLLVGLFDIANTFMKWATAAILVMCSLLLLNAPSFPVVGQILGGLVAATIGVCLIQPKSKVENQTTSSNEKTQESIDTEDSN